MFKLVIFDLDGTLFDSAGAIMESLNATFAGIGLGPYEWDRDVSPFFGRPFALWAEHFLGEGGKYSRENARKVTRKMFDNYAVIGPKRAKLNPGAIETLEGLKRKGVKLAVATNMVRKDMEIFLSRFAIGGFFDTACSVSDVAKGKPDPEELDCILGKIKKINVKKSEILMVGDSATDQEFARNSGIPVALLNASWNKGLEPDYRIRNLREVLGIV
jgi:phosphoglycolate phosphatase